MGHTILPLWRTDRARARARAAVAGYYVPPRASLCCKYLPTGSRAGSTTCAARIVKQKTAPRALPKVCFDGILSDAKWNFVPAPGDTHSISRSSAGVYTTATITPVFRARIFHPLDCDYLRVTVGESR